MGNIGLGDQSSNGGDINNTFENIGNKTTKRTTFKMGGNSISIKITVYICILMIVGLIAYSFIQGTNNSIVGTWKMDDTGDIYQFTEDGQFLYLSGRSGGVNIVYTVEDNKVILNISILWGRGTVTADFKVTGNTLTMSNFIDPDNIFELEAGETWSFTKIN